ncbi:hypothetical protein PRUB_a0883 [Pseudoalteromonas rubra]|uniref:Uncharacterized protein n=1 Tax=Pseudoalteromonas rubra TaxID=43658 RepID=A0A8T0C7I0_9GAMM|nr:hypothetical protein [Pseudoalteromonas rubra]KAF7786348.1 hypothetical protein PRUB_a0883 [Pseudoalteromonas rubra]
MYLIRYCVLFIFLLLPAVAWSGEWRLALCYGEGATQENKSYRPVIAQVADDVFSIVDNDATTKVKVRQCAVEPDLACYGEPEAIFCREEPFAILMRMAAWLAADSAFIYTNGKGKESALNIRPKLSWVDALLLADAEGFSGSDAFTQRSEEIISKGQLSADDINGLYSLVIDIYRHTNNQIDIDSSNVVLKAAFALYQQITQYAHAFLLGHEAYHFNNNLCHIDQTPMIKKKGIWDEMVGLQQKGGLFSNKISLAKHEVRADLCGFAWLEKASNRQQLTGNPVMNAMSRRVAIDLLAAPILSGMRTEFRANAFGRVVPEVKFVDGYLYPQTRLVLAAATLGLSEPKYPEVVKICGDTGKAVVTIIQDAYRAYPKSSGIVPDSLLSTLAPDIEQAWSDGLWSEESYRCEVNKG